MGVERGRPAVRGKLVDVILVVGTAALVVGAVVLNLATQLVSDSFGRLIGTARARRRHRRSRASRRRPADPHRLRRADPLPLRPGPAPTLRDALAGAIVTAILLFAISLASGYILNRTRSLGNIYGSLTLVLVFLYTMYLYASALLLGAEVASAWSRPDEQSNEPLTRQVRRAVLGLFVHQDPPRAAADTAPRADRPALSRGLPTRARSAPAAPWRGAPAAPSRGRDPSRPGGRGAACARAAAAASPCRCACVIPSLAAVASSSASRPTRSGSGGVRATSERPHAAVLVEVEVLLAEAGERVVEVGVRDDGGERLALEPDAGVEQLPRLLRVRGRRPPPCRRDPRQRLARQVEPVGEETERVLSLR